MSFEGYKKFLAERGIRSVISPSGKIVSTMNENSSYYGSYGYGGSYAPSVGGAIGVRGSIPRLIVISANQ
jgi:hypothetical protein